MPIVYLQNINPSTKLGVWHIAEPEEFFLKEVPLQRSITHPNKRLQHLAARYLLKELFADFPYELIRIATTKKPFLQNEAYHFSISHCGEYAAVIASKEFRVGVDVELITEKVNRVKHKFLSVDEQNLLSNIPLFPIAIFNDKLLTATWSIKESLFKWLGHDQVDFIKHLQIVKLIISDNAGIAECKILKHEPVDLNVHFLFFNNNCISWVLSNV